MPAAGVDKAWPLNVVIPTIDRMSFIWSNFNLYRTQESRVGVTMTTYSLIYCIGNRAVCPIIVELV